MENLLKAMPILIVPMTGLWSWYTMGSLKIIRKLKEKLLKSGVQFLFSRQIQRSR